MSCQQLGTVEMPQARRMGENPPHPSVSTSVFTLRHGSVERKSFFDVLSVALLLARLPRSFG